MFEDSFIKNENEARTKYYQDNLLFCLAMNSKILNILSIVDYQKFIKILHEIISKYHLSYIHDFFEAYMFVHYVIPAISIEEYLTSVAPAYNYFFNEYDNFSGDIFCFSISKNKSAEEVETICCEIICLFEKFHLDQFLYCIENVDKRNAFIDFCGIVFQVYRSYVANSKTREKQKFFKEEYQGKQSVKIDVKNECTVQEFSKDISSICAKLWNNLGAISELTYESTGEYKEFREELYVIYNYIRYYVTDINTKIVLGRKKATWDAKIGDDIIEVTLAVYENEHSIRKSMLNFGLSGLSLKEKTIDYLGKDSIISIVLDAIQRKIKKHYKDNRILIVATEGEFFEYFYDYMDRVIEFLKAEISMQDEFSKIYLSLDRKFYQLY